MLYGLLMYYLPLAVISISIVIVMLLMSFFDALYSLFHIFVLLVLCLLVEILWRILGDFSLFGICVTEL